MILPSSLRAVAVALALLLPASSSAAAQSGAAASGAPPAPTLHLPMLRAPAAHAPAAHAPAAHAPPAAPLVAPWFLGVPYGTTAPGDPLYAETRFDLFYPAGGAPHILGLDTPVMPVAVLLHGGNTNAPLPGPEALSELSLALLAQGFVVVIPSFHVLDLFGGEDYLHTTDDVARLVQFLRHHHAIVNIDPARVFCQGHSSGGFHALYLGLNKDFADPASADPVAHESSRPDFLVPWGIATDWTCVAYGDPATNPLISLLVFGVADGADVPFAAKQAQSPTFWVSHPQLYGCTKTPPMCLVYNLSLQTPCGSIVNLHDGKFGVLMLAGIGRFCAQGGAGQPACTDSVLLDSTDAAAATQAVVAWMAERAF
ncbi:MAG TPA: hypothetical protein VK824_09960 [Planctomycetota bacterium]|nr:hypothetical protein [Planctomycetota bacterium]